MLTLMKGIMSTKTSDATKEDVKTENNAQGGKPASTNNSTPAKQENTDKKVLLLFCAQRILLD